MPRAFSTVSTFAASISLRPWTKPSMRPCAWPFVHALAPCERMSGLCSGSVPSRAPIASAVRSSARHAASDIGSSVSAR